jgi:hypothetical protein
MCISMPALQLLESPTPLSPAAANNNHNKENKIRASICKSW